MSLCGIWKSIGKLCFSDLVEFAQLIVDSSDGKISMPVLELAELLSQISENVMDAGVDDQEESA